MSLRRPDPSEYAPFYATYVDAVPLGEADSTSGDILERLEAGLAETRDLLGGLDDDRQRHRYAPGKWSLRELVGHLIDTEWTFSFRALWFARQDPSPQPGMDQDIWVAAAHAHERPMADLLDELEAARRSTLALFRSFRDEEWARTGTASGVEFTVRALPYILTGHERHHRIVARERYFDS